MTVATDVRTSDCPDSRDRRQPARWAVRTAHLITLLMLPSGLWRVGIVLGFTMGIRNVVPGSTGWGLVQGWDAVMILGLTVVSEAVGLLSLGLVRPWGEVYPSWMPLIGGRRVPPLAATTVAAAGSVALMAIWAFATVKFFVDTIFRDNPGRGFVFANGWWEALLIACYLPLLLWGPLLLAITAAYWRRRRHDARGEISVGPAGTPAG